MDLNIPPGCKDCRVRCVRNSRLELIPPRPGLLFFLAIVFAVGLGLIVFGLIIWDGQTPVCAAGGLIFIGAAISIAHDNRAKTVIDLNTRKITLRSGKKTALDNLTGIEVYEHSAEDSDAGIYAVMKKGRKLKLWDKLPSGAARELAEFIAKFIDIQCIVENKTMVKVQARGATVKICVPHTPLCGDYTNMQTHRLKIERDGRYRFRPNFGIFGTLLLLPFMLGGLIGSAAALFQFAHLNWHGGAGFLLWSALFGFPLWWLLSLYATCPVFDPRDELFKRGFYAGAYRRHEQKNAIPFAQIAALQICEKFSGPPNAPKFHCWELNLILLDSRRVNVLEHGNGKNLHADAEKLAAFLQVELLIADSIPVK